MTEKEGYTAQLQKMKTVRDNFNWAIDQIDDLKNHLKFGLCLNGYIYKNDEINELKDDLVEKRNFLDNYIIPEMNNKINIL